MRGPVLEARAITKDLGEGQGKVTALKGVSLTLFQNEFTLLTGPSGSGKTTLLSILGCILAPGSGSLLVLGEHAAGRTPGDLAALRRRYFGFVFQAYNLFPALNALDNVKIALDVRGFPAKECHRRAQDALHEVGLSHRLKSYAGSLSGGEKQRVAIARALASSPSIILADEPTSALDAANGQAIIGLLTTIARNCGRTVLAVTHDCRAKPYADRVIEIEDGQIVRQRGQANSLQFEGRQELSRQVPNQNPNKRRAINA
ncbi:MAG: ABC transporter ATP-binding protein [Rhodomicrobium sp.]